VKLRFLIDQVLSAQIVSALQRYDPSIDVVSVGHGGPPFGALDPDILLYCKAEQRALVTENRSSMPSHEPAHFAAGHHHWGIFLLRRKLSIDEIADALQSFWGASEAEEWVDQTVWIPY
jgi:hypothetical protein